MRDIVDPLQELGATLVAITPQLAEHNAGLIEKHGLNFELLSDPGNEYAAKLGVRYRLQEPVEKIYRGAGVDLPKFNGDDSWTLPMPTRLVVDSSGTVRVTDIDPNYTSRPEPEKTVEDVKALD